MAGKIKVKRGTTAQWADSSTNDITLAPGQPGVEYCEDGKVKLKIGLHTEDGSNTEWDKIPYISAEGAEMIKTSTTGKNYIISDCAEENIVSLTAYGESVQDGTPTPDSPVEIVSVENPTITIAGKNLLNLQDRTDAKPEGGFAITKYDVGNVIYRGFSYSGYMQQSEVSKSDVTVDGNTVTFTQKVAGYGIGYVVKCHSNTIYHFSGTKNFDVFCAVFIDENGNKISNNFNSTFTTPANAKFIILCFSNNNTTGTYTITNPQLEIGSVATSYEPYNGEQTITIPYTFRGLKNSSGDWVARDELRVGDGKVEINSRVKERNFVGTENWAKPLPNAVQTLLTDSKSYSNGTSLLSNRFNAKASFDYGNVYTNKKYFYFAVGSEETVESWKAKLVEWNEAGNPLNLFYETEEETVTDITATEAGQALLALKTNYPNTSVISDIDCNIEYLTVDSIVDQKYNPNSVYPQSGRAVAEAIQAAETDKQDKFGDVEASGEQLEINNVDATRSIAFKGTDGAFLNVKTGTPSANDDSATKKYVDDTITSATKLNWKDATLIFYKNDGSEVSQKPIKYAEDNNFIYVYFSIAIYNSSIQKASVTLDINITGISTTMYANNLSYTINEGIHYETFFAYNISINPSKILDINFTDISNNIDFTGKHLAITGTYLFKK